MRRYIELVGVSVFLLGLLLMATYSRPNCSGIACLTATFPTLEISNYHIENGKDINAYALAFEGNCSGKALEVISNNGTVQFLRKGSVYVADRMEHFGRFYVPECGGNLTVYTVNTYFSNITPPNVTYDENGHVVFLSDYPVPLREFYLRVSGPIGFNVKAMLNLFPAENLRTYEITYSNGTLHAGDVLYRGHLAGILVKKGTKVGKMVVYDDPKGYMEFKNCTEHYNETMRSCKESGSPRYRLTLGLGLMLGGIVLFAYGMKF